MIRAMLRSGIALAAVLAVLGFAAAGCGGGGGGSGNNTTTTQKGNAHSDPAKEALRKVGLEVCSEQQVSGAVADFQGFTGGRIFQTAPDCAKAKSVAAQTTVVAATFSTHEAVAKGAAEIKKEYPKSQGFTYLTLVVAVEGPNAQKYAAELEKNIKPPA
jgi:hypothetical protein